MHSMIRLSKSRKLRLNKIFAIRKVKNQKKWTREEDELLISLAEKYNEKHWKEISKMFANKNALQCFSRYKRIRPGIVKGSWKKEEDVEIMKLVSKYGKSWSKISKILNTRNGKQIRDRFINVLDPEIKKGKFTDEEDRKLIQLFQQYGPKWATISKYYPNRTADMIKNRFHSSIKKKLLGDSSDLGTKNECPISVSASARV
jgi:myb proto-oncogene protein